MTYLDEEKARLEKIRTRGHLEVIIRPATFRSDRIDRPGELFPLIERARVDLGGWKFPYLSRRDDRERHLEREWAGHHLQWEHQLEVWRLFRSGLFFAV